MRRGVCLFLLASTWLIACSGTSHTPHDGGLLDAALDASPGCVEGWRPGPALRAQRENAPAFLLDDGRVLLVGGHFDNRTGEPISSSEIVDPEARTSELTGSFMTARTTSGLGPTLQLHDGRVLSGSPVFSEQGEASAEIWDPASGAWRVIEDQHVPGGIGVALDDRLVLVAGGIDWGEDGGADRPLDRAELWDATTERWTLSAPLTTPRTGHALLLVAGRAMAIGGFAEYPNGAGVGSSESYDAERDRWQSTPMVEPRSGFAVALRDGRVLAAGGTAESGGYKAELASAELYDPATESWSRTAPMHVARAGFQLTLLKDGRVLATGGGVESFSASTASAEIFDPEHEGWTPVASMHASRRFHAATLLPSGEVLVTGGYPASFSSEIFTPCPAR